MQKAKQVKTNLKAMKNSKPSFATKELYKLEQVT